MFFTKNMKTGSLVLVVTLFLGAILSGCGGKQQGAQAGATQVKAMKVIQQDTPLSFEYAGQVKGKDEIKVQAKVSGTVVQKFIKGGDDVKQ